MPAKIDPSKEKIAAEPAAAFDVKLVLADLNNRPGREAETQQKLEELAREDPKRPEPWSGLAYLAWRSREIDQAVDHFGKAFEMGERSPKMLEDYGMLAAGRKPEQAITAMGALLMQQPNNVEARLNLAGMYYNQRAWQAVLDTVKPIKSVSADQAPRAFGILATAQLELGDRAGARHNAQELEKFAKSDRQRDQARSILEYLDRLEQREARVIPPPAAPSAASPASSTTAPPELIRPNEADRIIEVPTPDGRLRLRSSEPLATDQGVFTEFVCAGATPLLVLETAAGRKVFALTQPNQTVITGHDGAVDFQCGPQKERITLRIQYAQAPEGMNVSGAVRAIHFDQ
jgi:Flp pilus assembly protein TadD